MTGGNPLRQDREARVLRVGDQAVEVAYDPDAELWYVRASSVPGLDGSAATLDALLDELPLLVLRATLP